MGFSRKRRFARLTDIVPAGQTKNVDIIPVSAFISVEYQIRYSDALLTKNRILTVKALKDSEGAISTAYTVLGDKLEIFTKVIKIGTDIALQVVNNEAFDVNVVILKTLL